MAQGSSEFKASTLKSTDELVKLLQKVRDALAGVPDDAKREDAMDALLNSQDLAEEVARWVKVPFLIIRSLCKLVSAFIFCWLLQTFFNVEPWIYWGGAQPVAPLEWVKWSAPFVGITLLAVAGGALSSRSVARPLVTWDEAHIGFDTVQQPGAYVAALFSTCTAMAAGIVYRGAFLNTAMDFVDARQAAALSSYASEDVRSSFGTLVASAPLPPILLVGSAVAATALFEVAVRVAARQLDNSVSIMVTMTEQGFIDAQSLQVVEKNDSKAPFVDLDEELRPTTASNCALELLLSAYLGAETMATHNLWASVGTHALGILLAVYACRMGLGEKQQRGDGSM